VALFLSFCRVRTPNMKETRKQSACSRHISCSMLPVGNRVRLGMLRLGSPTRVQCKVKAMDELQQCHEGSEGCAVRMCWKTWPLLVPACFAAFDCVDYMRNSPLCSLCMCVHTLLKCTIADKRVVTKLRSVQPL
jgi:hypothetical protein